MKTEPKYKIGDIVMFQAMPDTTKINIGSYYSSNLRLNLHNGEIIGVEIIGHTVFYTVFVIEYNRSYNVLEKDIISRKQNEK